MHRKSSMVFVLTALAFSLSGSSRADRSDRTKPSVLDFKKDKPLHDRPDLLQQQAPVKPLDALRAEGPGECAKYARFFEPEVDAIALPPQRRSAPIAKAAIKANVGKVDFKVTTSNSSAQKLFNQGMSQLHAYQNVEAERSFRTALQFDPNLAMAYWGMALASKDEQAGKPASVRSMDYLTQGAELAQKLVGKISTRELTYLLALKQQIVPNPEKEENRLAGIKKLVDENPNDLEAKAWLVRGALRDPNSARALGKEWGNDDEKEEIALLDAITAKQPAHPANQYRAQILAKSDAEAAVPFAERLAVDAPGIPQMWHTPSHVYSALSDYPKAAYYDEAALRKEHEDLSKSKQMPFERPDYEHERDSLVRNLANAGQIHRAVSVLEHQLALPRPLNDRGEKAIEQRIALKGMLMRYEMWDRAIDLGDSPLLESTSKFEELDRLRMLARANYGKGQMATAQAAVNGIACLLKLQGSAKDVDDKNKAMVSLFRKTATGFLYELGVSKGLRGDDKEKLAESLESYKKSATVANDWTLEAAAMAKLGDLEGAGKIIRKRIADEKDAVLPLAMLVDILQRSGKAEDAAAMMKELVKRSATIGAEDLSLPAFQRIKDVAGFDQLSIPKLTWPNDGKHPALSTLGPEEWTPPAVTSFNLPDTEGKKHGISAGQSSVLIFTQGAGADPASRVQLQSVADQRTKFEEAGFKVLVVSNQKGEKLGEIQKSVDGLPATLSDSGMTTFSKFGAFDQFNEKPLNGVVVVDGDMRVRWRKVGDEPFQNIAGVLAEARRLIPKTKPPIPKE